jgi:di/tricarboxylate transporter
LIWALAFGACLGGNGTLIGASANVVTAGMSEEAGYPISFNEFFKAGFPVMILTTFIVSLYMLLVFIVGGEDNATYVKIILVGITLLSIIGQLSRGRSKGKTFAEALVDDEMDGLGEMVVDVKDKVIVILRGEEE